MNSVTHNIILMLEDFELKEPLGKGSFGNVIKCVRKSDGEVYAMKQIKLQKLKDKDKKNALNEIRFLASIQNPYVVSYKEAFYDEHSECLCVVMEYANGGDLQGKIKRINANRTRIPEVEIWKTAYQVLEGLAKLHQNNIIHRDIKPANIFFHNKVARVGDLNVAKHLKDPFTITQTGTPYYASPEVWSEEPYNFKSDIWSLGCVLYEMATGKPPFKADTPEKLYKRILLGEFEKLDSCYSKQLNNLVAKMMTVNQRKRPCTKELLYLPKMVEMKEQFLELQLGGEELLKTIKFPSNLKYLNQNLPKAKYESKCKTTKCIDLNDAKSPSKKLPMPSLKTIMSEKNFMVPRGSAKDIIVARKPRVLNKNGSQKLIF